MTVQYDNNAAEIAADSSSINNEPTLLSKFSRFFRSGMFSMASIFVATQMTSMFFKTEKPISCSVGINDNHWINARYNSLPFFNPETIHHESQYITMKDGTELALDFYLAKEIVDMKERVPAIIQYTRHGRSYSLDFPFHYFTQSKRKFMNPRANAYVQRFISTGYAWVAIDVRGTGASGGYKKYDFSDQEIEDGYEIIEWIIQQPWSDGKVGGWGHGFDGIGAIVLAATQHPAIQAISLNGAAIDIYEGALYPGGVKNSRAIRNYVSFTSDSDQQIRWREIPTFKVRLMMRYFGGNIHPVANEEAKLQEFVKQHHANANLSLDLEDVQFRDDVLKASQVTFEKMNVLSHLPKIAASKIAILSFAGYYDMAAASSAILLHQYMTDSLDEERQSLIPKKIDIASAEDPARYRLILGPWSHAGVDNSDPFATSKQKCFWHLEEISRFFDYHFYPIRQSIAPLHEEAPIHYFSLVHNKWKATNVWPPAHISQHQELRLGPQNSLSGANQELKDHATLVLPIPPTLKYAFPSRWDMIGQLFNVRPNYYHDRNEFASDYLIFDTDPLPLTEVTGDIELHLYFSMDQTTINLAAYIEDVDETAPFKNENKRSGSTYITEALLNPVHTPIHPESSVYSYTKAHARSMAPNTIYKAVLKFEPVSYVIKQGHRLRLAIGVSPTHDFSNPSNGIEATELKVHFGGVYDSYVKIPTFIGLYEDNIVPKVRVEEKKELSTQSLDTMETETADTEASIKQEKEEL